MNIINLIIYFIIILVIYQLLLFIYNFIRFVYRHFLVKEKDLILSVILGLFLGLLFFPGPDFSNSILVGTVMPFDIFPEIIRDYLLFWSFLFATVGPIIFILFRGSLLKLN